MSRGAVPWPPERAEPPYPFLLPSPLSLLSSFDLLPLRVAAGGHSIDGFGGAQLVSAGFTLLQRSATLVRALDGHRSAVLVPSSHLCLVALAASDGRGALLIDPHASRSAIALQCADAEVGAVFTVATMAAMLPPATVHVLLDDAPGSATTVAADGKATRVDLGSHFGLSLEGDVALAGRDEECLLTYGTSESGPPRPTILTHRDLLAGARPPAPIAGLIAPLLAGIHRSTTA